MNSQNDLNSFNNNQYHNNNNINFNYSNNNYGQNNYHFSSQNNNYYNNEQYNNNYNGNIINYYNNNPVYSYIPPSFPSEHKNSKEINIEKGNSQNSKPKKGIILNIPKQDICYLRPPEFQPGYIKQTYGKPNFVMNNINNKNE